MIIVKDPILKGSITKCLYKGVFTFLSMYKRLPDDVYRVHKVELNNKDCELLSSRDFNDFRSSSRILAPTNDRPIANIRNGVVRVVGSNGAFQTPTGIFYTRVPNRVQWGYVVVNEKALYNSNTSVDFDLHTCEEEPLVSRILILAGTTIKQPDAQQAGAQDMQLIQNQQNS